jgi:hypothetical protein
MGIIIILVSLIILLLPYPACASDWWKSSFQERLSLLVINPNPFPLPSNYTVGVVLDHASLIKEGRSQTDGDDVRVVYHSGEGAVEVDRVLAPGSQWQQEETKILFAIQEAIEDDSHSYFIYFNNPQAVDPQDDPIKVYSYYEDFEKYSPGDLPSHWQRFGSEKELKVEVSSEQASSGNQSLKLSGTGWAKSAYFQSPVGQDYYALVSYLTLDQANEGGIYFRSDLSNQFHPTWIFQMGAWWYAGGGFDNIKVQNGLPLPKRGEWTTLAVKVVGKRIVSLVVNDQEGLSNLATTKDGDYLGVSFRGSKIVFYDDFIIRKAVTKEPKIEVVSDSSSSQPWLNLEILGEPEINLSKVLPFSPVCRDLRMRVETNQGDFQIWAGLLSPLQRETDGATLSPWDGSRGFGWRVDQERGYQPLSTEEMLIYRSNQSESYLELPLNLILATDYLNPAGDYQGELSIRVESIGHLGD